MSAFVWGIGTSDLIGRQPDIAIERLAAQAVREALADARVERVDACYVGTVFSPPGTAQRCLAPLGITDIPIITVENACASGTTAFHEARSAVESERFRSVLALGIEHLTSRFSGPITPEPSDVEGGAGLALPALYAMAASRYMAVYGMTAQELAAIAVKNRANAAQNPRAADGGVHTVDEVLDSRMIADPLTRLQCCGISDGAAAAIVGPRRSERRDVRIRSSALLSGGLWDNRTSHAWGFDIVGRTAAAAFAEASVEVHDIHVLEVHDAFTIGEVISCEAIGLASEGEGKSLATSGHTALSGRQPVNPSGGLLGRGHPLGATGLSQIYEIVTQLRGEAGDRQVSARLGLVETLGGGVSGIDGNGCVVAIFEAQS